MNPDVPTPAPISPAPNVGPPPVADSPNWFERQAHSAAVAGHDLLVRLDPLETLVEHQAKTLASDVWAGTAGFVEAYFERNKVELGQKAAASIVSFIVAQIPGASVEAGPISNFVVNEAENMFAVLVAQLQTQAKVAPEPAKP